MRKLILVAQCVEILALAVWVGGLLAIIAAVIPAVFNTTTMEVAGRMLTRTFQGYDRLVLASAAVLLLSLLARSRLQRDAGSKVGMEEVLLQGSMISIAVFLTFYLNPQTARLQEAAFASTEELAKSSAYAAFFRYHWIARALYLTNLCLGIAAICVKVRKWAK
jgi:uncharacterized membrane protein